MPPKKTPAQTPEKKAARVRTLNARLDKARAQIEADGVERDALIASLHDDDGLSFRAIGAQIDRSYVTVNKAHARHVARS